MLHTSDLLNYIHLVTIYSCRPNYFKVNLPGYIHMVPKKKRKKGESRCVRGRITCYKQEILFTTNKYSS